ncbi:MAG: hypothetical protein ACD_63C00157G0005, partial [uncultured bacterium]
SARLEGLTSILAKEFGEKISLANPWGNIYEPNAKEIPPISSSDSLSFTTVIGLAMRGIKITI